MEKCYKKRSRILRKNQHFFRQINAFTKELTKELILRKIFEHDQHNVEIIEIYSHASLAKIS